MSFSCQKGEFDRFFNRLDRPVEESRPDRQPDRPVNPTGFHLWFAYLLSFEALIKGAHINIKLLVYFSGFVQAVNLKNDNLFK